jgi:hypothetical protein
VQGGWFGPSCTIFFREPAPDWRVELPPESSPSDQRNRSRSRHRKIGAASQDELLFVLRILEFRDVNFWS